MQHVAAGVNPFFFHDAACVNRVLHVAHQQFRPDLLDPLIAVGKRLREVVAGVYMQERKGDFGGPERFARQVAQDDGVLAAGKQQDRPLELRGHFPQDVYGLGFEFFKMR